MKTVFLCTPHKLGDLNHALISRIKKMGFNVLCAVTHTSQETRPNQVFKSNIKLIKKSDVFVAVLKDYGKDLTAEVGMAYAWKKPTIGIDFNAKPQDVMTYYALDKIIKPEELEDALSSFLK